MKWYLVGLIALLPSLAAGQVPGVKLVYQDATRVARPLNVRAGQIVVGDNMAGIFPDQGFGRLSFYSVNGALVMSLNEPATVRSACFAGEHLYVASGGFGLNVLKDGQVIQNISGPRMNDVDKIAATPDGSTIITLQPVFATLTFWDRDAKSGKITKAQVFQADDDGVANVKGSFERRGKPLPIEKGSVRVPNFGDPYDLKVSDDGKFVFLPVVSQTCIVFGRDAKGWKLVDSLRDNLGGIHRYGMSVNMSLAQHGENVFVGGVKRLAWLTFDGKKLASKKFWVDDSEPPGHEFETVPYLDQVTSLAVSKNEKFLFVAGGDDSVTVLKIGKDDLELVGKTDKPVNDVVLEVELARDGKHLFANSRNCLLLVYELDATFTD